VPGRKPPRRFLLGPDEGSARIINDWKAKLWCRFFLLSVFATMYLNDLQRSGFYASLG
jgi:hypothetical protein